MVVWGGGSEGSTLVCEIKIWEGMYIGVTRPSYMYIYTSYHDTPVPRNCSPFEKASALTQPWCPEISVEYILSQDWSCWSKYDFLCRNGRLELLTRARSKPSAWIIPLGRVPVFLAVALPQPSGVSVFVE